MDAFFDQKGLIKWFETEKRDLPWRHNPTPYQVWISEVMLQQTQAATVIPYYERWMNQLPTLKDLASASIEDLIKLWEGLGYYSRVKNLHAAAKYIMEHHDGIIPSDPQFLSKIKGIGPYTLGAILSFAFHQRYPAVDGNVTRVLSRYFMIEEDISSTKTQRKIREMADKILPQQKPWVLVEALIELGATICRPAPKCQQCPLQISCKAHSHGKAHLLPYKSKSHKTKHLIRAVAVLQCQDKFLVRQVKDGQIMSGLHEFPYLEIDENTFEISDLQNWLKNNFAIKSSFLNALTERQHSFTCHQVKLLPFHLQCHKSMPIDEYKWLSLPELQKVAFPSGHRQVFVELIELT